MIQWEWSGGGVLSHDTRGWGLLGGVGPYPVNGHI